MIAVLIADIPIDDAALPGGGQDDIRFNGTGRIDDHARDLGERLHPWVQPKWYEIWDDWDADPRKDLF